MTSSYKEQLGNRKILMIKPKANTGSAQHFYVDSMCEQFEAHGLDTIKLSVEDKSFIDDLKTAAVQNDLIHVGIYSYDIQKSASVNFFDYHDIPNFAVLADHAYAQFMRSRVKGLSPNAHALCFIHDIMDELAFIRTDIKQTHAMKPFAFFDESSTKKHHRPFKDREFDILIAWNVAKTKISIQMLLDQHKSNPKIVHFIENLYTRLKQNDDVYSIQHFKQACMESLNLKPQYNVPWEKAEEYLLDLLHHIDFIVRTESRLGILNDLKRLPKSYKIGIMQDRGPDLGHDGVQYIGAHPFKDLHHYMGNARMTFDLIPTYKKSMQERVTSAVSVGCVPVVQSNPLLEDYFQDKKSALFNTSCFTLDDDILDLNLDDLEAISDNAMKIAHDNLSFDKGVEQYIKLFIASLD